MKSPRHFLLQRHQTHAAELDALRHRFIRQLEPSAESWWVLVWREIFAPALIPWSGLATLALLAIGLHLAGTRTPQTLAQLAQSPASTEEKQAAREERLQLWAELREPDSPPSQPLPNRPPSPPAQTPNRSALARDLWPA